MKRLLTVILVILAGCTRFEDIGPAGNAVKEFAVTKSESATTRAHYDEATRELYWKDGDGYFFYTYGPSAISAVTSGTLPTASSRTEVIPVTYDYPAHKEVTIGSVGTKVGAISSFTRESVTFTNGIPVVQDGTIDGSYVNIGTAHLPEDDRVTLASCQAYISFNLLDLTVGGKQTAFFTLESLGGETVCGDATYTVASSEGAPVGDAKKITVKVNNLAEETDYYVALAPGTYSKGLRILLYDSGTVDPQTGAITDGHINGYVDTDPDLPVLPGRILSLGELTFHKTVPATSAASLSVHPSDVHIVNIADYTQTKKLWIDFAPSDMTDIEIELSREGVVSAVRGPDEEYNDGTGLKKYLTVLVTPICPAITEPSTEEICLLTIRDKYPAPGTVAAETECVVTVGMWFDLGLDKLWGATNLTNHGSTEVSDPAWETEICAKGDLFPWGWKKCRPLLSDITKLWRWGEWSAYWTGAENPPVLSLEGKNSQGGDKYTWPQVQMKSGRYASPNPAVLLPVDDVCQMIPGGGVIPAVADFTELIGHSVCHSSYLFNNRLFARFESTVPFYEDVELLFYYGGTLSLYGGSLSDQVSMVYWSSGLREDYENVDYIDSVNKYISGSHDDYLDGWAYMDQSFGWNGTGLNWVHQYEKNMIRAGAWYLNGQGNIGCTAVYSGGNVKAVKAKQPSDVIGIAGEYPGVEWDIPRPDALPGVFTVGKGPDGIAGTADDVKVRFSKGNLFARRPSTVMPGSDPASPWTWGFYDRQYLYNSLNTGSSRTATASDSEIDLFTWGYGSWSTDPTGNTHLTGKAEDSNFTINNTTNEDWGSLIGDGQTWRTLTKPEWDYLISTRPDSFAKAVVNGVNGILLLPDSYRHPSGVDAIAGVNVKNVLYSANSYYGDDWTALENSGVVFLPAAGYRDASAVGSVNADCCYWSATASASGSGNMFGVNIDSVANSVSVSGITCSRGCSVRLVTPVTPKETDIIDPYGDGGLIK